MRKSLRWAVPLLIVVFLGVFLFRYLSTPEYGEQFFPNGKDIRGRAPESYVARTNKGMVASEGEPATKIALSVLEAGGSAVDAAIALSFAISVYRPHSTGIGGGGFILLFNKDKNEVIALDTRERAPLKATRDMFLSKGEVVPGLSRVGALSVATPGLVAGLEELYKKHASGKFTWAELIAPSVKLAREGFPVYPRLAFAIQYVAKEGILERFPRTRRLLTHEDGRLLQAGDILTNLSLAKTLEVIAKEGGKAFYSGTIARQIVESISSNGGILSLKDLALYEPVYRNAIRSSFMGRDVFSMPPPSSGGVHIIQLLNILKEKKEMRAAAFEDPKTVHIKAEAMRRAFADRAEHLGDPKFHTVPVEWLTSQKYAKKLANEIDLSKASVSSETSAGKPAFEKTQTTHFSIVDEKGNAVSSTQTINFLFGSGMLAGDTGIFLNDEMDDFSAKPGTPNAFGLVGSDANAVAPLKTPLSSMTPTIVLNKGAVELVLGSPGGSKIITAVFGVLYNVLAHGMSLRDAVFAPRIHHQWLPDTLVLDKGGFDSRVTDKLKAMGHSVEETDRWIGNVSAISVEPTTGTRIGVADPRRGGLAAGH